MRNEEDKARVELKVFEEFVKSSGLEIGMDSVRKGNADLGEPDIVCDLSEGIIYFELAEACAPEFAAAITEAQKTDEPVAVWGGDVSVQTVRKKLNKQYKVSGPISLVLYLAGRTALPDSVIESKLQPLLSNGLGPFEKVWLFGEEAKVIA